MARVEDKNLQVWKYMEINISANRNCKSLSKTEVFLRRYMGSKGQIVKDVSYQDKECELCPYYCVPLKGLWQGRNRKKVKI